MAKISDEGANSQLLFVLLEWLVIRFVRYPFFLDLQLLARLKRTKLIEIIAKPIQAKTGVMLLFSVEYNAPDIIKKSTPDKKYK